MKKSMKWDFKIVVLLVEWSSFWGGLKAGFYCINECLGSNTLVPLIKSSQSQNQDKC